MGLLGILRSGVKIADGITKDLQASVSFERCMGSDGYGTITFAAAVPLRAIVDWTQKPVRTAQGIMTTTRATVTLLDVAALSAVTGGLGVQDEDRITLPDGSTGPILDIGGFIDRVTGEPVATEVMLG